MGRRTLLNRLTSAITFYHCSKHTEALHLTMVSERSGEHDQWREVLEMSEGGYT
jgi:hypothetical protein